MQFSIWILYIFVCCTTLLIQLVFLSLFFDPIDKLYEEPMSGFDGVYLPRDARFSKFKMCHFIAVGTRCFLRHYLFTIQNLFLRDRTFKKHESIHKLYAGLLKQKSKPIVGTTIEFPPPGIIRGKNSFESKICTFHTSIIAFSFKNSCKLLLLVSKNYAKVCFYFQNFMQDLLLVSKIHAIYKVNGITRIGFLESWTQQILKRGNPMRNSDDRDLQEPILWSFNVLRYIKTLILYNVEIQYLFMLIQILCNCNFSLNLCWNISYAISSFPQWAPWLLRSMVIQSLPLLRMTLNLCLKVSLWKR